MNHELFGNITSFQAYACLVIFYFQVNFIWCHFFPNFLTDFALSLAWLFFSLPYLTLPNYYNPFTYRYNRVKPANRKEKKIFYSSAKKKRLPALNTDSLFIVIHINQKSIFPDDQ